METESNSINGVLPHLVVLATLLVLEYWIFTAHVTMLPTAGDYGPMVAIPLIVALIGMIMIIVGFFYMLGNNPRYKKIVSLNLILFVITIVSIFVEYIVVAIQSSE